MRILTAARDLARRKARERDGLFVVEGVRAVEELLASPLTITGVLCAPQLVESERGAHLRAEVERRGLHVSDASEREFASAATTESPQGVLALAEIPGRDFAPLAGRSTLRLLVLDAVQDPGNVGTLIRTAHALGADATLALPGTVDVWNAKVVRSAMGSLFRHHAFMTPVETFRDFVEREGVELWGADVAGTPIAAPATTPRIALAVGNEGSGLTPTIRGMVRRSVAVRMRGDAESLNVAVAAGILLHQLQP
jgi:TrmH family RNA methyltransferase